MILIEYTNLLNLEEFKSFERKVARTRVFKGRDVVDKVMEESIPLSRVGGPPTFDSSRLRPFTFSPHQLPSFANFYAIPPHVPSAKPAS